MTLSWVLEMNFYFCSNHATETYICRVNYLLLLDKNDVKTYNGGEVSHFRVFILYILVFYVKIILNTQVNIKNIPS
jgi:hypothetical protein